MGHAYRAEPEPDRGGGDWVFKHPFRRLIIAKCDEFRGKRDEKNEVRDEFRGKCDEKNEIRDEFKGKCDEKNGFRDEFRGNRDEFCTWMNGIDEYLAFE